MPTMTATLWNSPWLRPLNDVAAIDDLLAQVHPTWSLARLKARVERVIDETADVKTFVLRANRHWTGCRAGQHLGVEVAIDGVHHRRRYSLSSAPGADRSVSITVKRQPGGAVSNWLHDHVRAGSVLLLDPPAGSFVLPDPMPARLLMLSAGSGITPLIAMLRAAARSTPSLDAVFVHLARRPEDALFAAELAALAAAHPGVAIHHHWSTRDGRFDPARLGALVPDYAARTTLLCGPTSFMTAVRDAYDARGLTDRLHEESFGGPGRVGAATDTGTHEIRCAATERLFTAAGGTPLLEAAERGGLRPAYGCRMGICHTCSCVKQSGTVENVLTGEVSSEPGERIQLCISRARTDLVLAL